LELLLLPQLKAETTNAAKGIMTSFDDNMIDLMISSFIVIDYRSWIIAHDCTAEFLKTS